ncbi:cysteine desulfurase [bacterium]|nr:cysteine desulfurase [bacterium]
MEKIYLDHASGKQVNNRVLEYAKPYLNEKIGNPSSLYSVGLEAKRAVEKAREKVAALINADEKDKVIFTSGATESNNLAIKGTVLRNQSKGNKIAASVIEHISVVNPMKELTKNGFVMNNIDVDENGLIDLNKISEIVNEKTVLTSVMYANNEIGTIEPIKEVSRIVHENGNYLHVDATAAAGFIPIDVQEDGIDLLTLSSNDIYGPQGVGALYVKAGVKLLPVLPGGGQEFGIRSGTENLFGIVGMGEAARIAKEEMEAESPRLQKIRDALIEGILQVDESYLTGHPEIRLPHHASFRFSRIEGESILLSMDTIYGIQIATGSACSSKTLEASRVLLSIGLKHEEAHGSMVITLGRANNMEQVPRIIEAVKGTIERLRMLSPL